MPLMEKLKNFATVTFNQRKSEIEYSYYEKLGSRWEKVYGSEYIQNQVYIPNHNAVIDYRKSGLKDEGGFYKDIFGNPILSGVTTSFKYDEENHEVRNSERKFSYDIRPEIKFLEEHFEFDENAELPPFRIQFMDIETIVDDGPFLQGWDVGPDRFGYERGGITLISSYDNVTNKVTVFGLNELKDTKFTGEFEVEYIYCGDEKTIIREYMRYLYYTEPDIVSGWNSSDYDMPYICNRILYYIDTGDFQKNAVYNFGKGSFFINNVKRLLYIKGINSIDYMVLYKKFELKPRRSYSLKNIIKDEEIKIDGTGKIEYSGSIRDFYEKDWEGFVKYCVQDATLVKELDEKKKLIETMVLLCYMSGVPFNIAVSGDVSWLKIHDSAIYRFCRSRYMQVPENREEDSNGKFEGAYIKAPVPDVYDYITVYDVASLYPSCIRALNISIETFRGEVVMCPETFKIGSVIEQKGPFYVKFYDSLNLSLGNYEKKMISRENNTLPPENRISVDDLGVYYKRFEDFDSLREFLEKYEMCIAANGTIYTKKFRGIIPSLLDDWINTRKKYKKLYIEQKGYMQDALSRGEDDKASKFKALSDRYYTIQNVMKIRLNSLYGFISTPFSRFYDTRLSEAVTKTGQYVIKSTQVAIDENEDFFLGIKENK